MSDAIILEVGLTEAELTSALTEAHRRHTNRPGRWLRGLALMAAGILAFVLGFALARLLDGAALPYPVLLGFLTGYYFVYLVWRLSARAHFKAIVREQMSLQEKAGKTRFRFAPEGVQMTDRLGENRLSWAAVTEMWEAKAATLLRLGASTVLIPDRALPEKMSPEQFRAQITVWRGQA